MKPGRPIVSNLLFLIRISQFFSLLSRLSSYIFVIFYFMDQYIKKKVVLPQKQKSTPKNNDESIVSQLKQKLAEVLKQLQYSRLKLQDIKIVAAQVEVRLYPQSNEYSKILGPTPLQKSSVKAELFNGQAQKSDHNIQQFDKLERTQGVVNQIATISTNRRNDQTNINQLPQSGKNVKRGRKIIKKF